MKVYINANLDEDDIKMLLEAFKDIGEAYYERTYYEVVRTENFYLEGNNLEKEEDFDDNEI